VHIREWSFAEFEAYIDSRTSWALHLKRHAGNSVFVLDPAEYGIKPNGARFSAPKPGAPVTLGLNVMIAFDKVTLF